MELIMENEERILIVDDDESSRRTLKLIFKKKNYELEAVGTGREAIEKVNERFYNLALLDIKLPDMEGVELIKPLKELHPEMVVIMVTAYASMETAVRALNEGASAYINKPLNIEEVLTTIDNVLEKQRLIAEKREAEYALRESEERFRLMFESSHDLISITNMNGKTLWANPAWQKTLGYTLETQGELFEKIHPKDRTRVIEIWQQLINGTQELVNLEYRYQAVGGDYVFLATTARKLTMSDSAHLFVIARNITERKQAEEKIKEYTENLEKLIEDRTFKLRLSEERYRGLYESSIDGIVSMDMEERVVEYNQAFENMLGFPFRTVLELNYRSLIPTKWHDKIAKIIKEQIFLRGYSDEFEIELLKNEGTAFPVSVRMWLIKDEEDTPTGLWAVIRDITERKKLEQMRSDFINVAAHELRTPLSALKAHVDLLKIKLGFDLWKLPEEVIEKIEIIDRNSNRLALLINNILDYTRLEAGTIRTKKVLCSLDTLIIQVVQEVMPLIRKFNLEIDITTPKKLPSIYIDKDMIYTVISNLLSNAIKYTPSGGNIDVSILEDEDYLHFMVNDTGIGVSEEDLKKIFQPFHVADLTESNLFETKSEFERTGLGLAIANEYVTMHDGNIWAESILGEGSTFHVLLPKSGKEANTKIQNSFNNKEIV